MAKEKKNKKEFSKTLLIQESALVWITTLAFIVLAFLSISHDFQGELPWLGVLCGTLWAAYGVSQAFYYNKAKKENTKGGVKYMSVANELGIIEQDNSLMEEECEQGAEG